MEFTCPDLPGVDEGVVDDLEEDFGECVSVEWISVVTLEHDFDTGLKLDESIWACPDGVGVIPMGLKLLPMIDSS